MTFTNIKKITGLSEIWQTINDQQLKEVSFVNYISRDFMGAKTKERLLEYDDITG